MLGFKVISEIHPAFKKDNNTWNSAWYPVSDSFSAFVPPALHVRQKKLQVRPAWLHVSACMGLSPGKKRAVGIKSTSSSNLQSKATIPVSAAALHLND